MRDGNDPAKKGGAKLQREEKQEQAFV